MASADLAESSEGPSRRVGPRLLGLRYLALAVAPLALASGLAGGLWRLGWDLPAGAGLAALHGPLMISGLFGTLISLERAVALDKGWAYAAPILSASGTMALLLGAPTVVAASLQLGAAAVLAIGSGVVLRAQQELFTLTLLLGASAWVVGNSLWLAGVEIPRLVGWWIAFLVLTIAGERLEMSRMVPSRRGGRVLFVVSIGLIVAGAFRGLADEPGASIYGLGLITCALWVLRHDIARRNLHRPMARRFFAICMLAGYLWLAVAGTLMLLGSAIRPAFSYDMALHAVLIGFVLSMVFGHALIILPAVTGIRISYRPILYAPLAILHGSLVMRIAGGLLEQNLLRQWSGVATLLAIVLFASALAACRAKQGSVPQSIR